MSRKLDYSKVRNVHLSEDLYKVKTKDQSASAKQIAFIKKYNPAFLGRFPRIGKALAAVEIKRIIEGLNR